MEQEPFIPYVAEEDYPASLRPVLEPYIERMGFLPNALKLYMHRPEIAETLWKLNDKVMRDPSSTLEQGLKRRLAAVASRVNGCTYCTSHHCAILKNLPGQAEGWAMSEAELGGMLGGDAGPGDETEAVCFDFVRAASADPRNVAEEIYGRLRLLLRPPQIVELACLVGFWKMYNTVHDSLRVPLEAALQGNAEYMKK